MPAARSRAARAQPIIPPISARTGISTTFDLLPIGVGIFDSELSLVCANAPGRLQAPRGPSVMLYREEYYGRGGSPDDYMADELNTRQLRSVWYGVGAQYPYGPFAHGPHPAPRTYYPWGY